MIVPVRFRFLFTFAGSGIGLLLVLWLLPGGFGSVLYGIRDSWLRFVARRRGIVAPALVTDAGVSRPPLVRIPVRLRRRDTEARRRPRHSPGVRAPRRQRRAGRTRLSHRRRRVRATAGAVRHHARGAPGRDGRAARHQRRREVHDAPDGVGSPHAVPRQRVARRRRHQRAWRPTRSPRSASSTCPADGASSARSASPTTSGWARGSDAATVPPSTPRPSASSTLFPSLRDRLDEPAAGLSGGQQQMLTIAMSLLVEPKMLMIDELSLGLSPLLVEQLLGVVRAAARRRRDRDRRGAVGEHRAERRRSRLLPREGHDPLPRAHRRPARSTRPAPFDLPRRGGAGSDGGAARRRAERRADDTRGRRRWRWRGPRRRSPV